MHLVRTTTPWTRRTAWRRASTAACGYHSGTGSNGGVGARSAEIRPFLRALDADKGAHGGGKKKARKASALRRCREAPGQLYRLQKLNDKVGAEALFQKLCQAGIADSHCHAVMLRFDSTSERQRRGVAHIMDMTPPQPPSKDRVKNSNSNSDTNSNSMGDVRKTTLLDVPVANFHERIPVGKLFDQSYWDDVTSTPSTTVRNDDKADTADDNALLSPCSWTFSMLVDQLVLEGDRAAAERVIREEMVLHGVKPVPRTYREFNLPEKTMTLRRQGRLNDLIVRILGQEQVNGGQKEAQSASANLDPVAESMASAPSSSSSSNSSSSSTDADDYDFEDYDFDNYDTDIQGKVTGRDLPPQHLRRVADEFFEALCGNRVADAVMYTSMMKLCHTARDAQLLLGNMERDGVSPVPRTFHEIVSKALLEGDRATALRVVERDMADRGLTPEPGTLGLLKHSGRHTYSGKRLDTLNTLLREGEAELEEGGGAGGPSEAAAAWFARLQRHRVADVRAYNLMLAHTQRREDWLKLLGEMKGAGVTPNEETMAVLAKLMADSNVAVVRKPGGYKKTSAVVGRHKRSK